MKPSWTPTPLGDLLTERRETPQPVDLATGAVRIVSKIGFNEGRIELRTGGETKTPMILVQPGDLLVSGINAAKGAIAIYAESNESPVAATIHYGAYAPRKKQVDTKFLWWLLRSGTFRELLLQYVPGGIKTELKAKRLLPIPIPLPPLSEQKRIVSRIEELAGKIEEAKRLRGESQEIADTAFEAQVDQVLKTSTTTTSTKKLSDLSSKIGSGSTPRGGKAVYSENGTPFIRSLNVRMRRFQWDKIAFINPSIHAGMSGTKVVPGDVLLNITGASIGRVACAPETLVEANVSQHVSIIRPTDLLDNQFLMYWLSQRSMQDLIGSSQKGATREAITKAQIENFDIPLLSMPEQRRIVAYLDDLQAKVDSLKKLQAESSAELDALLPSILDKAFKGEL